MCDSYIKQLLWHNQLKAYSYKCYQMVGRIIWIYWAS